SLLTMVSVPESVLDTSGPIAAIPGSRLCGCVAALASPAATDALLRARSLSRHYQLTTSVLTSRITRPWVAQQDVIETAVRGPSDCSTGDRVPDGVREGPMVNTTLRDAFERWKGALIDQDKQTTKTARHRAHARVTSMEDLIAETPADDIEGVGIKLALYVYMSGVDPDTADSAVEQVLSVYRDCARVLGRNL